MMSIDFISQVIFIVFADNEKKSNQIKVSLRRKL